MRTFVPAGRVVAIFVHDGQERRLMLGEDARVITSPLVVATNKEEIRRLIAALRNLQDELPDAPSAAPRAGGGR